MNKENSMLHSRQSDAFRHRIRQTLSAVGIVAAGQFALNVTDASPIEPQENIKMTVKQTAGRDQLGTFAPTFARINDDILFGEVWSRTEALGLRDRSIVTVVALVAQGLVDSSLEYHLQTARKNGVTQGEIAEILTQAGFYAGWPKAWAAFRMAKNVWSAEETGSSGDDAMARHQASMIFPIGVPNSGFARYFTGRSWLAPLSTTLPAGVWNVTFEPAARNNWHVHSAKSGGGQILVCVAGRGWYQEEGKAAQALHPGDVVTISAGVKHWHGAARDSWFSHLAIEVPGVETGSEWLEPVDAAEYDALP